MFPHSMSTLMYLCGYQRLYIKDGHKRDVSGSALKPAIWSNSQQRVTLLYLQAYKIYCLYF